MAWNPELLSTSATIAEHEKEINEQAGDTQVHSLTGGAISPSADYEVDCPIGTDYVVYTGTDGNREPDTNVSLEVWTLPAVAVVAFECYDSGNNLLGSFPCSEGSGLTLTATNSETATLNNSGAWGISEVNRTWQDKINLARLMIKYDVENALTDRGYSVNELDNEKLADVVMNTETLRVACDYKTLNLIYEDLQFGGMSDLFKNKADRYYQLYQQELATALRRLQLDPTLSGTASVGRSDWTGKLSR